jgi:hypothetical protein
MLVLLTIFKFCYANNVDYSSACESDGKNVGSNLTFYDFGMVYNVSNVHNYMNCDQYMFPAAK